MTEIEDCTIREKMDEVEASEEDLMRETSESSH